MSDERTRTNETAPTSPARRSFLARAWYVLGGLACLQFLWIGFDLLRPRRRRPSSRQGGDLVVAGPVERFAPGSVTAFPAGRFYLSRLADGGFLALSRTCTHLGCTVPWLEDEQRFACPCHASVFDITGEVLGPPADRALDLYPVRIENGIVKVDLSAAVRRRRFASSQVAMP
jgi:cytochrome b6-f complex iron-sulfur subunit